MGNSWLGLTTLKVAQDKGFIEFVWQVSPWFTRRETMGRFLWIWNMRISWTNNGLEARGVRPQSLWVGDYKRTHNLFQPLLFHSNFCSSLLSLNPKSAIFNNCWQFGVVALSLFWAQLFNGQFSTNLSAKTSKYSQRETSNCVQVSPEQLKKVLEPISLRIFRSVQSACLATTWKWLLLVSLGKIVADE